MKLDNELVTVAKACILYRCLREVRKQRNYLTQKEDTVVGYVSGKWRLRKDALDAMKTFRLSKASIERTTYDLYADAFEEALIALLREGMLKEDREYPRGYDSFKRKFAITEQGIEHCNSLRIPEMAKVDWT